MRTWAKWTLGVAATVVGVVALRVAAACLRGDAAVAPPPVATHDADAFGDPLPEGAVARIGTIRWRARGPAVWAPDGEHLIVGGWDDELLAMNVRTGLVDWTMPGHAGKLALNIELRDLERIVRTGELPMVTDSLGAVVLMPDGHRLLTAGHSYRVWDLDTRTEVQRIPIHGSAAPVAVSRDGTLAASPWNSSFVRVVDLATGARRARVEFGAQPQCAAFDGGGTRVIAGFSDGRVGIARLAGGEPEFVKVSDAGIQQVLAPGDGHAFWALDINGAVTVRSLAAADAPPVRSPPLQTASPVAAFGRMVESPDLRIVAVSWNGEPIRWLDAATTQPVAGPTSEAGLGAVGWSPDGKLFAAVKGDGEYLIVGEGAPTEPDPPNVGIDAVAFSPDGRSIAIHEGTTLWIADAATGAVRSRLDSGGHVHSLTWTPDGAAVLLGMHGPCVARFDVATGRQKLEYGEAVAPNSPAATARVGPDGASARWFAADGALHVIDLRGAAHEELVVPLDGSARNRSVQQHEISAGLRRVAVTQLVPLAQEPNVTQETIRAWTVGTAVPFAEIAAPGAERLALSRDGRFAGVGWAHSMSVYDLDASPPRAIGGAQWTVRDRASYHWSGNTFSFSSDSARVAMGDADGVVHVFALPSCAEIATFRGHRATVESVAFSDDGTRLVSGSADMTALVWDLTNLPAPPAVPAAK